MRRKPKILEFSIRGEDGPKDELRPDGARRCDAAGCPEAGIHRAPKERNDLRSYYWFCLEHVRAYNTQWDFFKGMTRDEIEEYQRNDATWHRPTWRLNTGERQHRPWASATVADGFGLFGEDGQASRPSGESLRQRFVSEAERKALAVLDLDETASLQDIKIRYKELVKRYHPDANGGDQTAEDRLRQVIQANDYLTSRHSVRY